MPLAAGALREGTDVYLFLAGMIALAELAGSQGVYEWLGDRLARTTASSGVRAFWSVYAAGAAITVFLSNDATILLLTPAAIAVARRSGVSPLPFLYGTAFVANAASFVLPISNPANLLLYPKLPAPGEWLVSFGLPSAAAITVTGLVLFFFFRTDLYARGRPGAGETYEPPAAAVATFVLLICSCTALVTAASLHVSVGVTAAVCAAISLCVISIWRRDVFFAVLRGGQWGIIALVAVLLVAVRYADSFGAIGAVRTLLAHIDSLPAPLSSLGAGALIAALSNLLNNLPVAALLHFAAPGNAAALIGVDLGPNFALSGSLATLLWAAILRKHGIRVTAWQFVKTGTAVTVPALAMSLILVR